MEDLISSIKSMSKREQLDEVTHLINVRQSHIDKHHDDLNEGFTAFVLSSERMQELMVELSLLHKLRNELRGECGVDARSTHRPSNDEFRHLVEVMGIESARQWCLLRAGLMRDGV